MHPIIGEICRNHNTTIRPDVLRRWQRELKQDVQVKLDRLEVLEAQLASEKTSARPAKEISV